MAEQQDNGREVDFFDYVLADENAPGGVSVPQIEIDSLHGFTATAKVDRAVVDYQIGVEVSVDLVEWESLKVTPVVVEENATHQTLQLVVPLDGIEQRFMRLVSEPKIRPADRMIEAPSVRMVGIPAGGFIMGSSSGEAGRNSDEGQLTNVQHTRPFWMSATEVTQGQFHELAGGDPEIGEEYPMVKVRLEDAMQFADALDAIERTAGRVPEGYCYRLPTEAEWEYACRAGSNSPHYFGDPGEIGNHAWYLGNSFLTTRPVGQKASNAWGLYDMAGNVSEWCLDLYLPQYPGGIVFDFYQSEPALEHSIRGGHVFQPVENQRSAFRQMADPTFSSSLIGFRIVLAPVLVP